MKITLNQVNINMINENAKLALVETAEAIKTDLIQSQTMPFKTGTLQNNSTFVDDKRIIKGVVRIVSDTPYARRLYFHPEYKFYRGPEKESFKKSNRKINKENKSNKNAKQIIRKPSKSKASKRKTVRKYNKNAGGRWFDPYIDGDKKDLPAKYYKKFLQRRLK